MGSETYHHLMKVIKEKYGQDGEWMSSEIPFMFRNVMLRSRCIPGNYRVAQLTLGPIVGVMKCVHVEHGTDLK